MIEKFSEEELMQIKKELGLPVNSTKGDLFLKREMNCTNYGLEKVQELIV